MIFNIGGKKGLLLPSSVKNVSSHPGYCQASPVECEGRSLSLDTHVNSFAKVLFTMPSPEESFLDFHSYHFSKCTSNNFSRSIAKLCELVGWTVISVAGKHD